MKLRGRVRSLSNPRLSLSIARRGTTPMNMLDVKGRSQPTILQFKTSMREWVKTNINIKPISKFPNLSRVGRERAAPETTYPEELPALFITLSHSISTKTIKEQIININRKK